MTMTDATDAPTTHHPRLDLVRSWPAGYRAMQAFAGAVAEGPIEPGLVHLLKLRASQLNGCAYCLNLHAREARQNGEDQRRLDVLQAWREVHHFTDRERAALALTEAITLLGEGHVPDAVVDEAQRHFAPDEVAALVFTVVVINAWNRIAVTSRMPPS
jgi:AhpD family alkylhydroperoxidase